MPERGDLLREVMRETRTTQSALSRLSGVRQPSISQFLSGTVELSDDQLDRLLSCMGYRLEVTRRPAVPQLTRSERRSWRLHCRLSIRLTRGSLEQWRPVIGRNLERLRGGVTGQPHSRNLDRWESLVGHGDVLGLHRVLTGLDRDSIEMREVSPMGGLLPLAGRAHGHPAETESHHPDRVGRTRLTCGQPSTQVPFAQASPKREDLTSFLYLCSISSA